MRDIRATGAGFRNRHLALCMLLMVGSTSLFCQGNQPEKQAGTVKALGEQAPRALPLEEKEAIDTRVDAAFYALGWSPANAFAYYIHLPGEAGDQDVYMFVVQNLINDSLYVKETLRAPFGSDREVFWQEHGASILAKLRLHKIQLSDAQMGHFPALFGEFRNYVVEVETSVKRGEAPVLGYTGIVNSRIELLQDNSKRKIVDQRDYNDYLPLAADVAGYLSSPYSDRIALIVRVINRGWEGPPNTSSYYVVGARVGEKF